MEAFEESPERPKSRRWLIGLGIILILIIAIIFNPFSKPDEPYEEALAANPYSLKRWIREGEIINFSNEKCRGDIVNYNWNFDDGYSSDLEDPAHSFFKTGWYNVTLNVEDRKGNSDTGTYLVGVQPNNVYSYISTDKLRDVDPEVLLQAGTSAKIGPNIGEYRIVIVASIYEVVGECTINVTVETLLDNNTSKKHEYSYSTHSKKGEDISFGVTVDWEKLPEWVEKCDSVISVTATMNQGRWYWAEFSIRGYFYLKFLNPPF
jgi:hypothetical protein